MRGGGGVVSSWLVASCHLPMVTSGPITHSKFFHTSSKYKSLNHKFVEFTVTTLLQCMYACIRSCVLGILNN